MKFFAGERSSFGKRVAALMLEPEKHFPECRTFINLVTRSSGSDEARGTLKQHLNKQFIRPFSDWLGDRDAEAKSWRILSILIRRGFHPVIAVYLSIFLYFILSHVSLFLQILSISL